MKVLDRYILNSYLTKFLSFFVIIMVVFIFQTIWMFIDDLAGKELDAEILFKFIIFYCPKLIPLVLPLTVLLASIMTFGDLAENYEFAAIKSSGISLFRSMKSLLIFNTVLCFCVFFISNNLIPFSEFKSYNLRKNLAKVKPTLAITEGIFNNLGNMNIKVDDKYGIDNNKLNDVIIHKTNKYNDNLTVIKSKSGQLVFDESLDVLNIVLNDGYRYEEILTEGNNNKEFKPHTTIKFDKHTIVFDLKKFYEVDFSEEKYNNTFRMQNIKQLKFSVDSLEKKLTQQYQNFSESFYKRTGIYSFQTSYKGSGNIDKININNHNTILNDFEDRYKIPILKSIQRNIENQRVTLSTQKTNFFVRNKLINLHKLSYYEKFAISLSPLILFILGSSLGAIIRKGGFGYPVVFALMVFLIYHFIGTFSKNAAEDGTISATFGSIISTLVIFPLSIYLFRRASQDKEIFNIEFFSSKIISFFKLKK